MPAAKAATSAISGRQAPKKCAPLHAPSWRCSTASAAISANAPICWPASHDLRTPLTRMKLQLSLMPPGAEAEELTGDVEEMEKMVGAYLAFADRKSTRLNSSH